MPKTKLQGVVFTVMMVAIMVYAMVVYNVSIDMGGLSNKVFLIALGELIPMTIIGCFFEVLVAGPLAKKCAFKIVTPGKDKQIAVILAISAMTVCFMCPIMSFVATALYKGLNAQIIANWLQTTALNFPMALCWQIFFCGPFVRYVFGLIFKKQLETA